MAGHSKWAQIKRKKAVADARRGALFGKLSRLISIAARGNPDPSSNLRLKTEIERARAVNMPAESIERAIRRVADPSAHELSEYQAEFIGPGGVGILALGITDNQNRTLNELRLLAAEYGAHPAGLGSVAWMFRRMCVVRFPSAADADTLQLLAIDAGAEEVQWDGPDMVVLCPLDCAEHMRSLSPEAELELTMIPKSTVHAGVQDMTRIARLLETLDAHDDVQEVYTNADQ